MSDIHSENSEAPCEDIRALYSDLARNPGKEFGWGKGNENARALGYEARWLESLSEPVCESAAAVGNPFTLGLIRPGEVVVDLGCGAGADLCVSALLVGAAGHVIGIDLTPAMVEKARKTPPFPASAMWKHGSPESRQQVSRIPVPMSSFPMAPSTFRRINCACSRRHSGF